jgi:hypothetical protein
VAREARCAREGKATMRTILAGHPPPVDREKYVIIDADERRSSLVPGFLVVGASVRSEPIAAGLTGELPRT